MALKENFPLELLPSSTNPSSKAVVEKLPPPPPPGELIMEISLLYPVPWLSSCPLFKVMKYISWPSALVISFSEIWNRSVGNETQHSRVYHRVWHERKLSTNRWTCLFLKSIRFTNMSPPPTTTTTNMPPPIPLFCSLSVVYSNICLFIFVQVDFAPPVGYQEPEPVPHACHNHAHAQVCHCYGNGLRLCITSSLGPKTQTNSVDWQWGEHFQASV